MGNKTNTTRVMVRAGQTARIRADGLPIPRRNRNVFCLTCKIDARYDEPMERTSKVKYFIYARKSTESEDRQMRSIGDQLAELRELAHKNDLQIVDELVESQTAKIPGRPVFNQMIERIEKGEAAGIIAWHPDRLARNSVDGGKLIYLVDTRLILDLRFSIHSFEPTPQGKFMLAIAFGQSKYYVDNLSENIRRGQRQKLKSGIWPMVAPIGYLNDRMTRGIVIDPERAPLIRKTFELYSTGNYTIAELKEAITNIGLITRYSLPLSRSQFHNLLSNPIYYGLIKYGGECYDGTHEPIIGKSLFDTVQKVLAQRGHKKTKQIKPYLYRKLFHCGECGGYMTMEVQKGFQYVRCTKKKGPCSQKYVRNEEISRQIQAVVESVSLPEDWINEMTTEIESERHLFSTRLSDKRSALEKKIAQLDDKLGRLTDAYLNQVLSLDEYRLNKNKLMEVKASAKSELDEMSKITDSRLEPLTRFVKSLSEASLSSLNRDHAENLKILKKLGSNHKIQNQEIRIEMHEPWKYVQNYGRVAHQPTAAPSEGAATGGKLDHNFLLAEKGRFDKPEIYKVLQNLYLRLKHGNAKDLERLVDILKLHDFLPYLDEP